MMTDLERAIKALSGKQEKYNTLWDYYDGKQPLQYSTQRLREVFNKIDVRFTENWLSMVVDAALDRMQLFEMDVRDDNLNAILDGVWEDNLLSQDALDAHQAAMVTSEAFLIAWPNPNNASGIEVFYNDPRLVHLFYAPDNPKKKNFAAKWWRDEEESVFHLVLYYTNWVEWYVSQKMDEKTIPDKASQFEVDTTHGVDGMVKNTTEEIPVFHIRGGTRPYSQIEKVMDLQDAVNKMLSDMMVAAEFGAFAQRWAISTADASDLKNGPNKIWWLPAGQVGEQQSQVGQFPQTDLDGFLTAIDKMAAAMAFISKTPKHFFMNAGADVSGDALFALEAPLVARVDALKMNYGSAWQDLGRFILKLKGKTVPMRNIELIWSPSRTIQPTAEANAIQAMVTGGGFAPETAQKRVGWNRKEIEDAAKAKAKADLAKADLAAEVLAKARERIERTNGA
jgi:hypothetical protein